MTIEEETESEAGSPESLEGVVTPASDSGVAPSPDVADIVDDWREQQAAMAGATEDDVRFVINLASPVDNDRIAAELARATGLRVSVSDLFRDSPDLDRYRLLELPAVRSDDRADLFDFARFVRGLLTADTVDPDIPSPYYAPDRGDPGGPGDRGAESADWAGWCWVDPDEDKPQDPDWAVSKTRVPEAWDYSTHANRHSAGEGILIFQPDTGVVPGHGELPAGLHLDPRAANFVEADQSRPIDPNSGGGNPGHGTGTASVAISPVGGAMRGTAPAATLVPIRAIRKVAVLDQSRVAQAIDHARDKGAHIITMSLGGVFSSALHAAVRKAVEANVIVLAAAGNCVGTVVWPARYEEAIAVAGINEKYRPWKGSSRGDAVDIAGPAELVLRASTREPANPSATGLGQGTSFATAHLAGVAACWLAHHGREELIGALPPGGTLQELFRAALRRSACVPDGFDTGRFGAGITDALALVSQAAVSAAGVESSAAPRLSRMRRQVAELIEETGGPGQAEAARGSLGDDQNLMELACYGLDLARARRAPRIALEARPPLPLSRGLRRVLDPALARHALRGGAA